MQVLKRAAELRKPPPDAAAVDATLLGRGAAGGDGGVTPTTQSGSMAQLVSMAGVVHITIHSLQPGYVPLPGMHWWYSQTCVPVASHQLLHHSVL